MPRAKRPLLDPRKQPKQARSSGLVADILKAAVRVLEREGAERLTTIRVAEAAGVSVGSLYQYFPNKQAILFRLQLDEWNATGVMLDALLADRSRSPAERLRRTNRAFIQSECDEAPLRLALDSATPNWHDAPESLAQRERSRRVARDFVADAAPRASESDRHFAAELLIMTMSAVGKQISESAPQPAEIDRWADATASMLMAYFETLPKRTAAKRKR